MRARKTWLTKSGVEVFSRGRFMVTTHVGSASRRRGWKILAYRVDTGGFHGVLWLKGLREVAR